MTDLYSCFFLRFVGGIYSKRYDLFRIGKVWQNKIFLGEALWQNKKREIHFWKSRLDIKKFYVYNIKLI